MKTTGIDVGSQEYMEAMAALLSEAVSTDEGLKALAAAIAAPISEEIKRKEITPLLLTKHILPKGETPKYQKKPKVKAYWISKNGEAQESVLGEDEVEFSIGRIHSAPMVDISVLKHGNIGTLVDIQKVAATEIRKEIDKRTITVISAAVPSENTITVTGGKLTEDALNEALSILEDMELMPSTIIMRGARFNDMRGWDGIDPQTKHELRLKGIYKIYGGANILTTASADLSEVLIVPDEEIGKYAIRQQLSTESIAKALKFKTGWLVWMEAAQGVTRPDIITKIVIQP